MKLIIINGLPGAGKTTIAKPLADRLKLPLIEKDSIKEYLFDTLGVRDREWSRTLGMASNDFLYSLASILLSRGESVIIENAFEVAFAKPRITAIVDQYGPEVFEIYCAANKDIRRSRFISRNEMGKRHAGHVDADNYPKPADDEPLEKYAPINIGKRIDINTSDSIIDIDNLAKKLVLF